MNGDVLRFVTSGEVLRFAFRGVVNIAFDSHIDPASALGWVDRLV